VIERGKLWAGPASPWRRLSVTLGLVWLACVVGGFLLPRGVQVFDFVEKWVADLRVASLTPPMPQRSDIVLLTITEDTLSRFPYRSPIDRAFLAKVVARLDAAGARAVGMDILIDQPTVPEKDAALAAAVAKAQLPVVVGWADLRDGLTERQGAFLRDYLPGAIKAHVNLVKDDRDGTVRWTFPGRQSENGFRPGFAAALAEAVGVEAPRERARLLYRRGTDGSVAPFPMFPVHLVDVLPQAWFAHKIVLIGADLATEDRHRTPYATLLGDHEGSVPGVVIHALTLAQLLDGERSREIGPATEILVLALAAGLGIVLAVAGSAVLLKILFGLGFLFALWFGGFAVYAWGGPLLPLFVPSVAFTIAAGLGNAVTSQRYKAEKELAEAAVRARSEFLAMMSHEIRTPLNGVLGVIELLRNSALDREQQRMATVVQDSARSLLRILNDILDFSKIEANKVEIVPEPTSLRRLIDGVAATFAPLAAKKGIALDLDVAANLPEWVLVDPLRLRQVLVNLLGNAIKFTERGGVVLTCRRADAGDDGAERLVLQVKDSGIGMSQRAVARLFQPFTQADGSTTRRFGGTGLGLSISLKLIELMGGVIEVDSREGKGSAFSVTLPLRPGVAPADDAETALPEIVVQDLAASSTLDSGAAASGAGPYVLVAEDDPTSRWLVQRQLAQLGYDVTLTEDGRAALEAYRNGDFALVLTDYHMPEMDGLDLARALRRVEAERVIPDDARVPILALSADALPGTLARCRAAGIDDVLTKPAQLSVLRDKLAAWLGQANDGPSGAASDGAGVNGTGVSGTGINGTTIGGEGTDAVAGDGGAGQGLTAAATAPVLDTATFVEMFGGVNDDVRAALRGFLSGGKRLIKEIARLAEAGDTAALGKSAHRLAGESVSAGAVQLGRLCSEIERAAADDDWERIGRLHPCLPDALARVDAAIAEL